MLKKIGLFSIFLLNTSLLLSAPTKTLLTKEEKKARLAEKRKAKAQKSKTVQTAVVTVEPAVIAVAQAVQSVATEPQTTHALEVISQPAATETTSTSAHQEIVTTTTIENDNQQGEEITALLAHHIGNCEKRKIRARFAIEDSLADISSYEFGVCKNAFDAIRAAALEAGHTILTVNENYFMVVFNKSILHPCRGIIEYIKTV